MNDLGHSIGPCEDCGLGMRCDAYELPSGDRCLSLAVQQVPLDMAGWHIVQIQLCEEHFESYDKAGSPHMFTATPEQIAEAQRIADDRRPNTRAEQAMYDARRRAEQENERERLKGRNWGD